MRRYYTKVQLRAVHDNVLLALIYVCPLIFFPKPSSTLDSSGVKVSFSLFAQSTGVLDVRDLFAHWLHSRYDQTLALGH